MAPRSKKHGWIDWKSSPARQFLMDDLEPGGMLYQRDNIKAADIFPFYKKLPQFHNVVLDQFQTRLRDHRKKACENVFLATQEQQYLAKDRQLYPRQTHNQRGELVFDLSPAKALLREDIKNKLHLTNTPSNLQASREEYKLFKPKKFQDRICQEVRRSKYIFYLELKRAEMRGPPKSSTIADS